MQHDNQPDEVTMKAGDSHPLVSVGMPVYNEAHFIREALSSLLAQDYPNIEVIISDNCSTDETPEICREIADADARIVYYRMEENLGATANFVHVMERANGRYFMWASGHDLWSENLVSECVTVLEKDSDAAIAFGTSSWIDSDGEPLSKESGWCDTRGMDNIARFFSVFWGNMHPILGLMRLEYLRELPRIYSCAGADLIIQAEMAIKGDFIHAPSASWSRREVRDRESHKQRLERYKSPEYHLVKTRMDRMFPLLRMPLELVKVVLRANFSLVEKGAVLMALFPSFVVRYISGKKAA